MEIEKRNGWKNFMSKRIKKQIKITFTITGLASIRYNKRNS